MKSGISAVNTALHWSGWIWWGQEGINVHPQQGEDGSQQYWPHNNYCWSAVLSSHQTLEERIEMDNHPECKEQLSKERTPWLISAVDGIRDSSNHTHKIDNNQCGWRNQERSPLECVKLPEVLIFWRLGCNSEVCINTCANLENTLEQGKQMCRHATNNPELLISPPFIYSHSWPSHLQNTRSKDGDKERNEPQTRKVGDLKIHMKPTIQ